MIEVNCSWHFSIGIVCREHIVGLKALVMSVDRCELWPCELQIEIYETLKLLVHMINCEKHFGCLLGREVAIRNSVGLQA